MNLRTIQAIAGQELLVNFRNKWTVLFAIIFGTLVVGIAGIGTMTEGFSGVQDFSRTSASILNLVLYIIPLVALTMGTLSFTGDEGSMELLFSQPVSRGEVFIGKYLGLFMSITLSTLAGFAGAGIVILSQTGVEGILSYAAFVALSLLLSSAFLSIAAFVAIATGRKAKAFGVALFCWFFFVLFYDLLVLGGTVMLSGKAANMFLFFSLFGNPVDLVRVSSLIFLDNATIFGAAGAALLRFVGGALAGISILVTMLLAWSVLPLYFGQRMLNKQDI